MNKIGAIIEARMGSSRLPGKILMDTGLNISFLEGLVERIRRVSKIEEIIVATTTNPLDDELEEFCNSRKITVFRGSEENVIDRVLSAAKKSSIDIIVEITGDCPIIDHSIIEQVLNTYLCNNANYVSNANVRGYPDGMDVQIFSTSILDKSSRKNLTRLEKEHVTLEIRNSPEYSKINVMPSENENLPHLGLTLDEESDLKLLRTIFKHFGDNRFNLNMVLDFLKQNPALTKINSGVIRKGDS